MRTRLLLAVLSLLACSLGPLRGQAVIEGRVALPKSRAAPVMVKRYEIITKGGVVATMPPVAIVYLEGPFPRPETPPVAQIGQKDFAFMPQILPVQAGTRVEFPNFDDTYHNIFSYSAAKRFDLGRYRADEKPVPSQVFDTPGLVTLRCDIHEHMRALILVLDTPHFVLSENDGRYRLGNLPAGRFILKVWLDGKTTLERPVELEADSKLQIDFP
jgi:hypothetical protein